MLFFLLGCIKTPPAAPVPQVRHFIHDRAQDLWLQVDDLEEALDAVLVQNASAETLVITAEPDGWLVRVEERAAASDVFEWGDHRFAKDGTLRAYHHQVVGYGWHCSSPITERVDIDYTAVPSPTRTHTLELEEARDSDPDCSGALEERRSAPDPGWEPSYSALSQIPIYVQIIRSVEP